MSAQILTSANVAGTGNLYCVVEYNGELYAGGYDGPGNANLLKWNGVDDWVDMGASSSQFMRGMCVFNDKLYLIGSSYIEYYDSVTDTITIAASSHTGIDSRAPSVVFNNELYYGGYDAQLFSIDTSNNQYNRGSPIGATFSSYIAGLLVHDGVLYLSTQYYTTLGGRLYTYNSPSSFTLKAPRYGTSRGVRNLTVYKRNIYGSESGLYTTPSRSWLYKWNGVDAWELAADEFGSDYKVIDSVANGVDALYCTIGRVDKTSTALLKWNEVDAWEYVDEIVPGDYWCYASTWYDNTLYMVTSPSAYLARFNDIKRYVYTPPAIMCEGYPINIEAKYTNKIEQSSHVDTLQNPEYVATQRSYSSTRHTFSLSNVLKLIADKIYEYWETILYNGVKNVTVIDHKKRFLFEASWNVYNGKWKA